MEVERGEDWDGYGPDDDAVEAPGLAAFTPPYKPPRRFRGPGPYLRKLDLAPNADWPEQGFPFAIPALRQLVGLSLEAPITLLAGDNGAGKSTIIELLADAMAFAPEGGELVQLGELPPKPRPVLNDTLRPDIPAVHPANGYFLRAESFFNIAEFIDEGSKFAPDIALYGGVDLHGQSHGQSFLALAANRFGANGFYLLDEPEAALSVTGCLALLAIITRAARAGAQFIIATHSPILLACPDATIYELDEDGINPCSWEALDAVRLTRAFLDAPERFIDAAIGDTD